MELNITNSEAAINKAIFGQFSESKERIEAAFGAELEWQRLDTKKACRVSYIVKVLTVTTRRTGRR